MGYRVFLLKHAMNLAVPGLSVYNWDDDGRQQVIALAEGDEARITAFRKVAEEKRPELAEVSDVTFEPYDGDIGRTSELAMLCSFVQLDKAIPELLGIRENTRTLIDGQSEIRENTKALVDMQSEMIDEIQGLREDLVGSREWQRRIERDISIIKAKLRIQ